MHGMPRSVDVLVRRLSSKLVIPKGFFRCHLYSYKQALHMHIFCNGSHCVFNFNACVSAVVSLQTIFESFIKKSSKRRYTSKKF